MTTSISETAIPSLTSKLGTLLHLLEKAEDHARTNKMQSGELLEARLAPDMYSFSEQIQTASDNVRRGLQRLSGAEPASVEDPEPTFESLREYVQGALRAISKIDRERVDASADQTLRVSFGPELTMEFTGRSYLLAFLLPNCMFHVSTAYGILRSKNVELGKNDLLGPFIKEFQVKFV
jgi:hypothetical protein